MLRRLNTRVIQTSLTECVDTATTHISAMSGDGNTRRARVLSVGALEMSEEQYLYHDIYGERFRREEWRGSRGSQAVRVSCIGGCGWEYKSQIIKQGQMMQYQHYCDEETK